MVAKFALRPRFFMLCMKKRHPPASLLLLSKPQPLMLGCGLVAALRAALASDPEGVKNAFTKSTKNGAATNGLMASIQEVTDKYAATTGATKGILIEKAGSQYSPATALDNDILDKMEDIDEEIAEWQDKMSDKVDYYTNKFTQLELLINQMNSQSSALAGLTGGSY